MEKPGVGVGVIINHDGKILFGKRKSNHGYGTWGFPGGKIEMYESFSQVCKREVKEETNYEIELLSDRPVAVTNDIFSSSGMHYVTLFFSAKITSGLLKLMEPDECEEWRWFSQLPSPLFFPVQDLIKQGYTLY